MLSAGHYVNPPPGSVMDDALKRESETPCSTHTTQPPNTTQSPL